MDDLKAWMRQLVSVRDGVTWPGKLEGWRFSCNEDLLLKFGSEYRYGENLGYPIPKACYHQAYSRSVRKNSPWIYVEGMAWRPGVIMPVNHAWVTRADTPGVAYELAWNGDNAGAVYIGIQFSREYMRKCHLASKASRLYSVLDTWWMDYPLLSGVDKIEEVMLDAARS